MDFEDDINEDVLKFGTPKSENDSFQWRGRPLCDIAEELGMHYTIPIILLHHMRSQHTHTHTKPCPAFDDTVELGVGSFPDCKILPGEDILWVPHIEYQNIKT